eukprot:m.95531 g.95531  ORF g.95531 m.95531 type:complete len:329 (+) comp8604_c0_seq2:367-1353(+)
MPDSFADTLIRKIWGAGCAGACSPSATAKLMAVIRIVLSSVLVGAIPDHTGALRTRRFDRSCRITRRDVAFPFSVLRSLSESWPWPRSCHCPPTNTYSFARIWHEWFSSSSPVSWATFGSTVRWASSAWCSVRSPLATGVALNALAPWPNAATFSSAPAPKAGVARGAPRAAKVLPSAAAATAPKPFPSVLTPPNPLLSVAAAANPVLLSLASSALAAPKERPPPKVPKPAAFPPKPLNPLGFSAALALPKRAGATMGVLLHAEIVENAVLGAALAALVPFEFAAGAVAAGSDSVLARLPASELSSSRLRLAVSVPSALAIFRDVRLS